MQIVLNEGAGYNDCIKSMEHVVYILECADGTLYVGSTNDLTRRLVEHNTSKKGAHYTKIRRPVELRYAENVLSLGEARRREAEIKRWDRKKKIALFDSGDGIGGEK